MYLMTFQRDTLRIQTIFWMNSDPSMRSSFRFKFGVSWYYI
jgi:hypothetical protein